MSNEITTFIEQVEQPWQQELCHTLRQLVHDVIPDVTERIQYKKPHFLKDKKYAAVISVAKAAVSFTIFNTAEIELTAKEFTGPPERKTIKFQKVEQVDSEFLKQILSQTVETL
ncbi:hypothetical protein SAMN04488134_11097 [Amphibacillus marinus]|uniref:YdhG-like domain-containing protein n=1 Tax=Amphibacillus marinus TaxID=872970 RepID=A0A1H8RHZ2_9BACI|nr:DUF1801 domain-containing protein [Amphibacillus marinus]SEO66025.1 hypothetical protein SAMN04488134_11097 [Amphibacillus marinus]